MRIYKKTIATLFALSLFVSLTAAASPVFAQVDKRTKRRGPAEMPMQKQMELHNKAKPLPGGTTFYIEAVAGPPIQYSILVTDNNGRSVPGTYVRPQIDIFDALLSAAKEFALTAEEAGTASQPKVTRFIDKHETAFFIDVQKAGNVSHFFVTIKSLFGVLTIDAGAIKRVSKPGEKEEPEPLFYKIMTRVQQALAANPTSTPQVQQ
jgi:hypothetical protein